jgi:cytochrome c biogenesis protein CcmG, thiol:disulfide interchange protein DsbE
MARSGTVVVGLNYKDKPEDATGWLRKHGDPYRAIVADRDGRVGIDYGVYGVPETFVIDREGIIRFKQIGPITPEVLQDKLLPLLKKLDG